MLGAFLGQYQHKATRIPTQTDTKRANNTNTNRHKIPTQTDTFLRLKRGYIKTLLSKRYINLIKIECFFKNTQTINTAYKKNAENTS